MGFCVVIDMRIPNFAFDLSAPAVTALAWSLGCSGVRSGQSRAALPPQVIATLVCISYRGYEISLEELS